MGKLDVYGIKIIPKFRPNSEGCMIEARLPKNALLGLDTFTEITRVFNKYGCIPKGHFMVSYWEAV